MANAAKVNLKKLAKQLREVAAALNDANATNGSAPVTPAAAPQAANGAMNGATNGAGTPGAGAVKPGDGTPERKGGARHLRKKTRKAKKARKTKKSRKQRNRR